MPTRATPKASPPDDAPTDPASSAPAPAPGAPPPRLPGLDTQALRLRLAGFADPGRPGLGKTAGEKETMKALAGDLCLVMAQLFGDDLDRVTLWERIGTGLSVALSRTHDEDLEAYVTHCLDHVRADPGKAAANATLSALLGTVAPWPAETRLAFLDYINKHRYAVVVHGRRRWEEFKEANKRGGGATS